MIEMKNGKKILTTPISAEDLADIHIGDIIYLNGSLTTCRDVAHRRLVEYGRELPYDIKDKAIFQSMSAMPLSSMPDQSSVHSKMENLNWFRSDRPPVCVWKNLKKNL